MAPRREAGRAAAGSAIARTPGAASCPSSRLAQAASGGQPAQAHAGADPDGADRARPRGRGLSASAARSVDFPEPSTPLMATTSRRLRAGSCTGGRRRPAAGPRRQQPAAQPRLDLRGGRSAAERRWEGAAGRLSSRSSRTSRRRTSDRSRQPSSTERTGSAGPSASRTPARTRRPRRRPIAGRGVRASGGPRAERPAAASRRPVSRVAVDRPAHVHLEHLGPLDAEG